MINFEIIEKNMSILRERFISGIFEYVVIDDFLEKNAADDLYHEIPDPLEHGINKSRDYVFAKNKFEKSNFRSIGSCGQMLYTDLISQRFETLLHQITGQKVFVDPEFHGGGIHQGGKGSFLDMHADFNYHPLNNRWFRNLNVLIYLNPDWIPEYGGELKLINKKTNESASVEPLFNRCVIMFTRDYTLHGYNKINFPEGTYRRSIAVYAYSEVDSRQDNVRSTTWYPEHGGVFKKVLGKSWPILIRMKNKLIGSSTAKNK